MIDIENENNYQDIDKEEPTPIYYVKCIFCSFLELIAWTLFGAFVGFGGIILTGLTLGNLILLIRGKSTKIN